MIPNRVGLPEPVFVVTTLNLVYSRRLPGFVDVFVLKDPPHKECLLLFINVVQLGEFAQ